MESVQYEDFYQKEKSFSFGKNWKDFVNTSFSNDRVDLAKTSLVDFIGGIDKIKGKTFVDIGCGSGLFSLAAFLLGAKEVISVDVDENSIACTDELRKKYGGSNNWKVVKGSALDSEFIQSLGQFDIVYSWGVLHHTGDMYRAFNNVSFLLKSESIFYLAIYNRCRSRWIGTSEFWLKVKKLYNYSGSFGKKIIFYCYVVYFFLDSLIAMKNPFKRMKSFKRRGMNWHHNVIDWIGGYPYEYAGPDEIINYFAGKRIFCEKIANAHGLACVEYLLRKIN